MSGAMTVIATINNTSIYTIYVNYEGEIIWNAYPEVRQVIHNGQVLFNFDPTPVPATPTPVAAIDLAGTPQHNYVVTEV